MVFGAFRRGADHGLSQELVRKVIDMASWPGNPSRDTRCGSLFVNLARLPHNYLSLTLIRSDFPTDANIFMEICVFRVPEF